jgi:hypothetical protein
MGVESYTGNQPGRYGAFVLVIVYIALTIYAELKPDRFLAAFGETDKH